jgi:phosphoglucomutase
MPAERVAFGTSGHRGCSLDRSFNEAHILAITQAICLYRKQEGIDGPLYIGIDTHALSEPAFKSALEVLAGNGVDVMVDARNGYTPTPVISHAILSYNRSRKRSLADGIVITPSHNPPRFGGFKYNPPDGGPADTQTTGWIQERANALIADGLRSVVRMPSERARTASTTHPHDYLNFYVNDLSTVVDMQAIAESRVHIGVDPLGGASVAYWEAIGDRYGLNLEVVNHRSHVSVHDGRLGWPDPNGPFVGVRDGADGRAERALRRRFRMRSRCRSPWNREPQRGAARSEPLSRGCDFISFREPPAVVHGGSGR